MTTTQPTATDLAARFILSGGSFHLPSRRIDAALSARRNLQAKAEMVAKTPALIATALDGYTDLAVEAFTVLLAREWAANGTTWTYPANGVLGAQR